jgi:DNA-binding IclR family transcriptional regulator
MSRVQSIERAFAVLGALADGPLGVTEISERVRLPKSTVARLLRALQDAGAVDQAAEDSRYRIGGRMARFSGAAPTRTLVEIAGPILEGLAASTGEATGLSVPEDDLVHYVAQVDSANPVAIRDWTGTRIPLHTVSSGLVFLAHRRPAEIDAFLARPLERFTAWTATDPIAIRRRLRNVQRDGYAWTSDEYVDGISSIAAPVTLGSAEVVAAIHVHGPTYRFSPSDHEPGLADRVVAAAARLAIRGA